ncbi:hypothetical protein KKG90_12695 [Candidatus Bipolaricaulota bacterium]|nr:hypothetical protein [Candidatus Bipolaricaulota bacterium]
MAKTQFPLMRRLRLTAISRRLMLALGAGSLAFTLLLIHVFAPVAGLQVAALAFTGIALLAAWTAVLCWRMPVFSGSTLWTFTLIWCVGLCGAVLLVLATAGPQHALIWKLAVQWLAFSLSLSVGGLQFRALFHRRATPLLGRFLSLLSPLAIVILILIVSLRSP